MSGRTTNAVRCAIYTRVSTDAGLEQEFNSLDAQYDAAQAYIRSQAHAGWTLIKSRYDDGGFSGGSTDRPALQQLLADVRVRKINVIVVYKVDRLTRSLADFAKLVELFDAHDVSFVSVTQQFNTTTSMGRLTLNVLLSFAQFEREVTAERIRDKVAASKRKGLWVGGMVPLGYRLDDGKLSIEPREAEIVKLIFTRYLELGSVNRLAVDLKELGLRSKVRRLSTGASRGGVPFTQGPLFYMLRNRFYLGEVNFKGEILPGPQPALLERSLFDAVQEKLTAQWQHRNRIKQKSQAMLSGLVFDDAGRPMVVTHSVKKRVRYRYYISAPLRRGHSDEPVGSVSRVPAHDIEAAVTNALHRQLQARIGSHVGKPDKDAIRDHVARVDVRRTELAIHLKAIGSADVSQEVDQNTNFEPECSRSGETIITDWIKPPMRRFREVMQPASAPSARVRPIRAERRAGLIKAIARGRLWLDEIVAGTTSVENLAARHKFTVRQINLKVSMAFLAPALVKAAIEGRLAWGVGITQLRNAPSEWLRQFEHIGLPPPSI